MKWRMPFLIISLPLHMPNCHSLSLPFPLTLLLFAHPSAAFSLGCRRSHCCPAAAGRKIFPRFRSRRCQQDDLSCSRFYLFVFIIQQNQLRLHPVTPPPSFLFPLPCLCCWHGRGQTGWLLLFPSAELATTCMYRFRLACCWL